MAEFSYVERKKQPRRSRKGKQPMSLSLVGQIEAARARRADFSAAVRESTATVWAGREPLQRALCIGPGSLSGLPGSSRSIEQLVVFEKLLEILQSGSSVELCDPAFNADDLDYFNDHQWTIISTDAPLTLQDSTLLYMPHAPKRVFERLLRSNWSTDGLCRLLIVGNRLASYLDSEVRKDKRDRFPCISRLAPHLHCEDLPALPNDLDPLTFNDIAIQTVPASAIATLTQDADFWQLPPAQDVDSDEGE